MAAEKFEDRYLDVLQNIESTILSVFTNQPQLIDAEVRAALEVLLYQYQCEVKGRPPAAKPLSGRAQETFAAVHGVCEWRLGRLPLVSTAHDVPIDISTPNTPAEMILCLKRLRKSLDFWTARGGRQGYLSYIQQFFGG